MIQFRYQNLEKLFNYLLLYNREVIYQKIVDLLTGLIRFALMSDPNKKFPQSYDFCNIFKFR